MADDPKTLVSTAWLEAHLKDPDLRVLDASWYLPDAGRDAKAEYAAAHIPAARFFDIEEISDKRSGLPHMAPPPEMFISRMRAMGVGDGHQVVVYDGSGLFSAARVWWTFRLMGKVDVAVLDGGYRSGRPKAARSKICRRWCAIVTSPCSVRRIWSGMSPKWPLPPSWAITRSSTRAP